MAILGVLSVVYFVLDFVVSAVCSTGVDIPVGMIGVLVDLFQSGIWILGLDIWALFITSVVFWWVIHGSIGFVLWAYEKIPFI